MLYNFLPGPLAGALLTGLLFFLNPDLPFSGLPVLRGTATYGLHFGGLFLVVLTPFTRLDEVRARRLLPWTLTTVLAAAAVGGWVHASYYSFHLPPGINVRLLKSAAWLTLAALITFYTALLHTLHRRAYGRRSVVGVALVALAAIYVMLERREAYRPPSRGGPLPTLVDPLQLRPLYVIGLDGATLDAVLPLAQQGQLPFFGRLLREGSYGRLESFAPTIPYALWTTLATGKLPFRHRISGELVYPAEALQPGSFLRLLPRGLAFAQWGTLGARPRRTDATLREALTHWEILAQLGQPAGALGWPASHPAHGPVAFDFSERYFQGEFRAASARPEELVERGVFFHLGAGEIDPESLEELGGPLPYGFLEVLSSDLWVESLSDFLQEQTSERRALFLRLEGLGEISHRYFGGYSRVQFAGAHDHEALESARCLAAYYRHLDRFLARLWADKPADALLAVVSASGYREPKGLARLEALVSGTSEEGLSSEAPDGLVVLLGSGIRAGTQLSGAGLVDVLPTLLYAQGLPIARDFDGQVLTDAFESTFLARHPLSFVPSYEALLAGEGPAAPVDEEPLPP